MTVKTRLTVGVCSLAAPFPIETQPSKFSFEDTAYQIWYYE